MSFHCYSRLFHWRIVNSDGYACSTTSPLQWRHNEHDSVSNHQPHDCLHSRLFRRRSKKTSKLRVTGLCAGDSPWTGEFPAQTRKMFPFDDVIMHFVKCLYFVYWIPANKFYWNLNKNTTVFKQKCSCCLGRNVFNTLKPWPQQIKSCRAYSGKNSFIWISIWFLIRFTWGYHAGKYI